VKINKEEFEEDMMYYALTLDGKTVTSEPGYGNSEVTQWLKCIITDLLNICFFMFNVLEGLKTLIREEFDTVVSILNLQNSELPILRELSTYFVLTRANHLFASHKQSIHLQTMQALQ
jgi:hypothetical protein